MEKSCIIYVLRHAKVYWGDHENSVRPLSVEGEAQAQGLIQILSSLKLNAIYSSPYLRAKSTVKPFCEHTNMELRTHEDLREGSRDESIPEIKNRIVNYTTSLAQKHLSQSILLCTHGGILFGLLSHINPTLGEDDYKKLRNPDLKKFIFNDNKLTHCEDFHFQ
ncbi:MAG: histidine phosphatase family protein [Fibrobacteres bacterium]|nr:histidine phosphatase family protein [Fibrobacterota bacterium]